MIVDACYSGEGLKTDDLSNYKSSSIDSTFCLHNSFKRGINLLTTSDKTAHSSVFLNYFESEFNNFLKIGKPFTIKSVCKGIQEKYIYKKEGQFPRVKDFNTGESIFSKHNNFKTNIYEYLSTTKQYSSLKTRGKTIDDSGIKMLYKAFKNSWFVNVGGVSETNLQKTLQKMAFQKFYLREKEEKIDFEKNISQKTFEEISKFGFTKETKHFTHDDRMILIIDGKICLENQQFYIYNDLKEKVSLDHLLELIQKVICKSILVVFNVKNEKQESEIFEPISKHYFFDKSCQNKRNHEDKFFFESLSKKENHVVGYHRLLKITLTRNIWFLYDNSFSNEICETFENILDSFLSEISEKDEIKTLELLNLKDKMKVILPLIECKNLVSANDSQFVFFSDISQNKFLITKESFDLIGKIFYCSSF